MLIVDGNSMNVAIAVSSTISTRRCSTHLECAAGPTGEAALAERRRAGLLDSRLLWRNAGDRIELVRRIVEEALPTPSALLHAMQWAQEREVVDIGSATQHDPAGQQNDLEALGVHLANGDMAATASMDALQRRVGGDRRLNMQPMADAIDVLDFECALRLCRQLLSTTAV